MVLKYAKAKIVNPTERIIGDRNGGINPVDNRTSVSINAATDAIANPINVIKEFFLTFPVDLKVK